MKKPEEIKKGLAACGADECHGDHTGCPYTHEAFCIQHVCADALALIQQLEAQVPRWISVEERLPEPGVRVLVAIGAVFESYIDDNGKWQRYYSSPLDEVLGRPTHWMPLPQAPKEVET